MKMLSSKESLDFLESFFRKHIKGDSLNTFLDEVESTRIRNKEENTNSVPMRDFHEKLMQYRKQSNDFFEFTKEEDEIWDELLAHWI